MKNEKKPETKFARAVFEVEVKVTDCSEEIYEKLKRHINLNGIEMDDIEIHSKPYVEDEHKEELHYE